MHAECFHILVVRAWDDRAVKKVFLRKPDGRRKAGRPKLRWLNCVRNDMKLMSVKRWRKKAEDTSVWAVFLKEVLQGPYTNSEKDEGETEQGSLSEPHAV
jgi:hypothetical protein